MLDSPPSAEVVVFFLVMEGSPLSCSPNTPTIRLQICKIILVKQQENARAMCGFRIEEICEKAGWVPRMIRRETYINSR